MTKDLKGKSTNARRTIPCATTALRTVPCAPCITIPSNAQLDHILSIDSKLFNVKEEYLDNKQLYYIAIVTWEYMFLSNVPYSFSDTMTFSMWSSGFLNCIVDNGLITVVTECNRISDLIISQTPVRTANSRVSEVLGQYCDMFDLNEVDARKRVLQNLRYLKRFSPSHTEALESEAVDSFKTVEVAMRRNNQHLYYDASCRQCNNCKSKMCSTCLLPSMRIAGIDYRTYLEDSILERCKSIIRNIFKDYEIGRGYFSSGSVTDADKTPASKLATALKHESGFLENIQLEAALENAEYIPYTYCAEFLTVPKSFKARRSIAKEETGRQFRMQAVREGMQRCLASVGIFLDHQEYNQEGARIGSKYRSLATIDLSAASDHVGLKLVQHVFADVPELLRDMMQYRSTHVKLEQKKTSLAKAFTSGSALCFPTETAVFYAFAVEATERCGMWLSYSADEIQTMVDEIIVYGDDIIVPSIAAETLIEALELFGFDINVQKTHYAELDPYRESCGKEYWEGYDISSLYFPRKALTLPTSSQRLFSKDQITSVVSMIDLQHRLIHAGLIYASDMLTRYIKTIVPDITESYIDSEYNDIWKELPFITKCEYDPVTGMTQATPDCPTNAIRASQRFQRTVEVHYTLTSMYQQTTRKYEKYADMILYNRFLVSGPSYNSPLDELLRVTDNQGSRSSLVGARREVFKKLYY